VVVAFLVVDDGEDLGLDADLLVGQGEHFVRAEDSVVEGIWYWLMVPQALGPDGRVGPVDLVGLADLHVHAVFQVVGFELGIGTSCPRR